MDQKKTSRCCPFLLRNTEWSFKEVGWHICLVRHPADDHRSRVAPRPQPEPRRSGARVELVLVVAVLVTGEMQAVAVMVMAVVVKAVANQRHL